MRGATGCDREEWFTLLDEWGAAGRPYREIAAWLTGERHVSRWWAQKLIVEFEQDRGLRAPGARRDGTYAVTAGKTIAAPTDRLFASFVDTAVRERWLPGAVVAPRTADPGRSARFTWEGGPTRLSVGFSDKGGGKTTVHVEHERLPDAESAKDAKAYWRERLAVLKAVLEN
ncbi:hypothetical protein LP52_02610 [Streptomonospora alba]|uniref:Activator of Hsp90 ATPase homologue 1/2-like C-terminal domain-containing protein n=1 Tax=Streptomonospora alba TaxID=183763 RepID=A0A0C2FLQ6_9ACTN|nr:SRPBCC domain-containing protein [Streptomonospora alba]KII00225.1 hypothetical protein LP52_02610 [Streptomonospora alba]